MPASTRRQSTGRQTGRQPSRRQPARKNSHNKAPSNASVMRVMVVMLVFVTCVAAVLGYMVLSGSGNSNGGGSSDEGNTNPAAAQPEPSPIDAIPATDKIRENIFINNIDVGLMTKSEAVSLLNEKLADSFKDKKVTLTYMDKSYEIPFDYFNAVFNIDSAVADAFAYAEGGSATGGSAETVSLASEPYNITAEVSFDENAVRTAVRGIEDEINAPPKDASVRRDGGEFVVTKGIVGLRLDVAATALSVADCLRSAESGTVPITVNEDNPRFTASDIQNATSLIGSFKTVAAPGSANRDANIANALSKINNVVLYPGEVFSTNDHFGEMTYDNGYRMANVIQGGQFVEDMGGGVCQVSSTLYMALLYAELEIVERQNHSLKVSYVDYGFDATLAGNYIDLKFKNNTDYPILIEGIMNGSDVIVNIYGYEIHQSGRTLKFTNNLLSTTPAPEEKIIEDDTLPLGEEKEETPARSGFRYELIKTVFQDGEQISSTVVNRSTYKATARELHVGTNPDLPRTTEPTTPTEPTDPTNPSDLPDPTEPVENPDPSDNTDPSDTPDPPQAPSDWPDGIPLPSDLTTFTTEEE